MAKVYVTNKICVVGIVFIYSLGNLSVCSALIILIVNLNLQAQTCFYISAVFEKDLFSLSFGFVTHTPLLTSQWLST